MIYRQYLLSTFWVLCALIPGCKQIQRPGPGPEKSFIKYYGDFLDQEAVKVIPAADDGFLLLGTISKPMQSGSTDKNIYLVKLRFNGNELWSRTYGSDFLDEISGGIDVMSTANSYIIGATAIDSFGNADPYLLMIDQNGVPVWERAVENNNGDSDTLFETLEDVIVTEDGGVLLAGDVRPIRLGDERLGQDEINKRFDTYLMKVNADGSPHPDWDNFRIWGYPEQDHLRVVKEFETNKYSVLGTTQHDEAGQASTNILYYLSNQEGIPWHAQSIGTTARERGMDMVRHNDGKISIIGSQFTNQNESAVFLARLDQNAGRNRELMSLENQQNVVEEGVSIQFLEQTEAYIVAGTSGPGEESHIYLMKVGLDGNTLINNSFAQNGKALTANVLELEDGFLVSATVSFGLTRMMCLIKTDADLQLNSR